MPFGVFFCGGLQALEGLLVQGRGDTFPPKPKRPVQAAGQGAGKGAGPSSKTGDHAGPLRRLRSRTGGSKAQKEGGGPAPKGGPPPV